jgi:hypothetical protein
VYGNYYNGGTAGPNNITVKASVENPTFGTVTNTGQVGAKLDVTFRGAASVVIEPGGVVVSDLIPMRLLADQYLATRTYVSVASAGQKWPIDLYTKSSNWEGATRGAPIAVIGVPFSATRISFVGLVGDSIM